MPDIETDSMTSMGLNASAEHDPVKEEARKEALRQVREAHSAAARYARMTGRSGELDLGLPALSQAVGARDAEGSMEMQERIGRSERALAWGIAVADLQRGFPQALRRPAELEPGEVLAGGIVSWLPLLFLNPGQRSGFKGKASDPRWQSLVLILAGGGLTEGIRHIAARALTNQTKPGTITGTVSSTTSGSTPQPRRPKRDEVVEQAGEVTEENKGS